MSLFLDRYLKFEIQNTYFHINNNFVFETFLKQFIVPKLEAKSRFTTPGCAYIRATNPFDLHMDNHISCLTSIVKQDFP